MASSASSVAKRKSEIVISKPPCKIHPSAIVADKAQITGTHPVTISENVVVHPHARIRAEGGTVTIGKNSIIYEKAVVGTSGGGDASIGAYVNIESGAIVEAKSVGDGTEIGVKAIIRKGAVIGKWCKVSALEIVDAGDVLEDHSVVYGDGQLTVNSTVREHEAIIDAKMEGQEKAVQLMRRLIPSAAVKWVG